MKKSAKKKKDTKDLEPQEQSSPLFGKILSVISILGFLSIVSETFTGVSMEQYLKSSLLILMGLGFLFTAQPLKLIKSIHSNFQNQSISSIVTLVVGALALIAGILALPQIDIQNNVLNALNGIIAIVAIIFIIIETWIIS